MPAKLAKIVTNIFINFFIISPKVFLTDLCYNMHGDRMKKIIKVDQLTKSYGEITVLDNISLSIDRGMVFGLIGANGAGKSTTIECILGTKKADNGKISILEIKNMVGNLLICVLNMKIIHIMKFIGKIHLCKYF